jgi:tetratricopeptide (TPR) repeat protein
MARQNNIKKASAKIDSIKKNFPDKPDGYHGQSIIYAKERKYDLALKNINTALRINHKNPRYYIDRGYIYYNLKNFSKSRIDFQTALRFEPDNPHANYGLGEVLFREDQLEKAAECLRKALNKDSRLPKANLVLASIYFDQDKFRECLEHYYIELENIKKYGSMDDFHEGACFSEIARTLAMLDQPDEALKYIEKFKNSVCIEDMYEGEDDLARSLIEDLGNAYIEIAAHYPQYYQNALYNYKKTLEFTKDYSNMNNFFHYFQCGWALYEMGRQEEAMKYFNNALKWQPKYETRYEKWMKGHIFALQGKYETALKYLNHGLKMDPAFENIYYTRGFVYFMKGDKANALKDMEMVDQLRQKGEAIAIFHRKAMDLKNEIEKSERIDDMPVPVYADVKTDTSLREDLQKPSNGNKKPSKQRKTRRDRRSR